MLLAIHDLLKVLTHGLKSGNVNVQARGGIPNFEVTAGAPPPAPPLFTCRLIIPTLPPGANGTPTQTLFIAEGRTKKAAEHTAAAGAMQAPDCTTDLTCCRSHDIHVRHMQPCLGWCPPDK